MEFKTAINETIVIPPLLIDGSEVLKMLLRRKSHQIDVSEFCSKLECKLFVESIECGKFNFQNLYHFPKFVQICDFLQLESEFVKQFIPPNVVTIQTTISLIPFFYSLLKYNYSCILQCLVSKYHVNIPNMPISYYRFKKNFKRQLLFYSERRTEIVQPEMNNSWHKWIEDGWGVTLPREGIITKIRVFPFRK